MKNKRLTLIGVRPGKKRRDAGEPRRTIIIATNPKIGDFPWTLYNQKLKDFVRKENKNEQGD